MPDDDNNVIPFPVGGRRPLDDAINALGNVRDFVNGVHQSVVGAQFRLKAVKTNLVAIVPPRATRRAGSLSERTAAQVERTDAALHVALDQIEALATLVQDYENALRRI